MTTRRRSKVFSEKTNPPKLPHHGKAPAPRRRPANKPRGHHKATRNIPVDGEGQTAIVFATGPSLTPEVIEQIRPYHEAGKVRTCGLNDSYKIIDFLDEFYACDEKWWKIHINDPYFEGGQTVMDIDARMWGNQTAWPTLKKYPHVNVVQGNSKNGFSKSRDLIHWGNNSGYQMLNLVSIMGFKRIILVGYNMGVPAKKEVHFFGKHPKGLSQGGNQYKGFVRNFATIQDDIKARIVNCTPESMLDKVFQHAPLQEELDKL